MGEEFVSDKPHFKNVSINGFFNLIQLSSTGDLINQIHEERLGFVPPEFPGGFPLKFFGLYQGENGLILLGKWFNGLLVQFNSENAFSPCLFSAVMISTLKKFFKTLTPN